MSYIALYRKWRPLVFEDVVEQEYVVKTLKNSIKSDRIAHAYLFCGSRGTGKTSIAKIFSRAVNCLNSADGDPCNKCEICTGILSGRNLDVLEIDAASNNGVDNVREIRDEVIYTPTESKYKVYIIDEVHMLSTGAFNALLKTLEEPPSHVIFILATTEAHKLPATILSRCQRFDFRRISADGIAQRIHRIAVDNGVKLQNEAASLIARLAEGGMRDAISILDQCISTGGSELAAKDIMSVVGLISHDYVANAASVILNKDTKSIFTMAGEIVNSGKDIRHFVSELIFYFRDMLVLKLTSDHASLSYPIYEDIKAFESLAVSTDDALIMSFIKDLSALENSLKWSRNPRVTLEVALIKLCERKFIDSYDQVNSRILELEGRISSGFVSSQSFSGSGNNIASNSVSNSGINSASNNGSSNPNSVNSSYPSSTTAVSPPKDVQRNPAAPSIYPDAPKNPPAKSTGSTGHTLSSSSSQSPVPIWNEVINEARLMGRMLVYTSLLDSTAYFVGEKSIIVNPANAFNCASLSKFENLEIVRNILNKKLNSDVIVKIAMASDSFDISSETEEPSVKKARDIAEFANIPFNIIDE